MLNMSVEEIRDRICLKEEYWEYRYDTNCYAFALGLDIPENDICTNCFQPGVIASNILNISLDELSKINLEERLILDFKVLKLGYILTNTNKNYDIRCLGNYHCNSWDILLFLKDNDFHFARINYNGEMYHKIGYLGLPKKTSIDEIEKDGYYFSKRYRLRYWKKQNCDFS